MVVKSRKEERQMVCPMCITAFVVSNAHFIVGTGAMAVCAMKLKQAPSVPRKIDRDSEILKHDKKHIKAFAERYSLDDD